MYNDQRIKSALESMLFVWGDLLPVRDAARVLELETKEVRRLLETLQREYEEQGRGLRLREVDGSYQLVTCGENEAYIEKLCTPVKTRRLSQAALETLAIIAYRQPVTRGEIDAIRGIKSERVIEGLINKDLVEICGRSEGIGRPLIYRTTAEFLKQFGFTSLKDLPDICEFEDICRDGEREPELHEQMSLRFDEDEGREHEPEDQ